MTGLINYFGKSSNVDDVVISPLLFQKGSTRLAIYGMGNIRDERLFKTFTRKNVTVLRPNENQDDWFNVFVLHQNRWENRTDRPFFLTWTPIRFDYWQNYFLTLLPLFFRVKHGPSNYIPEQFLPQDMDLVIWGHEHECLLTNEYKTRGGFYICQPGSSVATSLTEGEAASK